MDHEDLSALSWGLVEVPDVQPGLSLDYHFELEDCMPSPLQLQPALSSLAAAPLSSPPSAPPETRFEQACASSHATTLSSQPPLESNNFQMLVTSPLQPTDASRPSNYSESSTIPEDQSEAFTGCDLDGGDGGAGGNTSTIDRGGPPYKRRRISSPAESPVFDRSLLQDLRGTTAAQSRLMTDEERNLMLLKRRLRNRASAARSREKQRSAVQQLSAQIEILNSALLNLKRETTAQQADICRLREQNNALRAALSVRSRNF